MFRADLQASLREIFGVKKTTFLAPSETFEQDTLFIDVVECKSRISPGQKAYARVVGGLTVFTHDNRLPFGFFAKRVQGADSSLTKDFFFYDLDQNALNSPARLQDICEIRAKFVYLWAKQYDPNQGELTSCEIE